MLGTSQQTGLFSFISTCQKAFPSSPQRRHQMLRSCRPNGADRGASESGGRARCGVCPRLSNLEVLLFVRSHFCGTESGTERDVRASPQRPPGPGAAPPAGCELRFSGQGHGPGDARPPRTRRTGRCRNRPLGRVQLMGPHTELVTPLRATRRCASLSPETLAQEGPVAARQGPVVGPRCVTGEDLTCFRCVPVSGVQAPPAPPPPAPPPLAAPSFGERASFSQAKWALGCR